MMIYSTRRTRFRLYIYIHVDVERATTAVHVLMNAKTATTKTLPSCRVEDGIIDRVNHILQRQ